MCWRILVKRRRSHHAQLTAGEHRLEHVARVHGAFTGSAGTDDRVQLVDERHHLAVAALDLVEDSLEPLLELAAVLRPGDHRTEVERHQTLAPQRLRDVAGHDALSQALDDRCLPHARLTDEDGIVLRTSCQDLNDPSDLRVTADHRIDLALTGQCGEIDAVLVQSLEGPLRVGAGDVLAAAKGVQGMRQRRVIGTGASEQRRTLTTARRQAEQEVLGGQIAVAALGSALLGGGKHPLQGTRCLWRRDGRPARPRQLRDGGLSLGAQRDAVGADGEQQGRRDAVGLVEQGQEHMRRLELRVAVADRALLRGGDGLLGTGGDVHGISLTSLALGAALWSPDDHRAGPMFGLEPGDAALQPVDLVLEGEDTFDALEVDALVGQPLHLAQDLDVPRGVEPLTGAGPTGRDESQPVVLPERLCVQSADRGGHRDDVDGRLIGELERLTARRPLVAHRPASRKRSLEGRHRRSSPARSRGLPWRTVDPLRDGHLDGDEQVPGVPVPLGDTSSLDPERLAGGRAAGTRKVTGLPSSVGTLMSAPSAASGKVTGAVSVRRSPLRPKTGCAATCTVM